MEYISFEEAYNLGCDILDIPLSETLGKYVIILLLRCAMSENIYKNKKRSGNRVRLSEYIQKYYKEKKRITFEPFKNEIILFELKKYFIKMDEILTEYNCKDDEENKERNEFLFLYHQLINKYMV